MTENLYFKGELEILSRFEFLEPFIEISLTFICELGAPDDRSTKSEFKRRLTMMNCKEVSVLRASTRSFLPWLVNLVQLLAVNETIGFKRSLTLKNRDWWIAKNWILGGSHWDLSRLDLWFESTCSGSQQTCFTKFTYPAKPRLMDCRALSVLRHSLRHFKPWSVNSSHLLAGQQNHS